MPVGANNKPKRSRKRVKSFDWNVVSYDAYLAYRNGRYKETIASLEKWLPEIDKFGTSDEKVAYAYGLLGKAYYMQKNMPSAIKALRKAADVNLRRKSAEHLDDLWWVAHCYEKINQWKRAANVYQTTAAAAHLLGQSKSSWPFNATMMRGFSLFAAKQKREAFELFDQALKNGARDYVSMNMLTWVAERFNELWRSTKNSELKSELFERMRRSETLLLRKLNKVKVPLTNPRETKQVMFGETVKESFRWLENTDSPEVAEWIAGENRVSQEYLNSIPGRAEFLSRLHKLYPSKPLQAHWKVGEYHFYSDRPMTKLYRSKKPSKRPQLVLDSSAYQDDVVIQHISISKNGKYVAYWVATKGSDWQTIRVRNMSTGKDVVGVLKDLRATSLVWRRDSSGFYYSKHTRGSKGTEIRFHKLGTAQSRDKLIYKAEGVDVYAGINLVASDKFLLVTCSSTKRDIFSSFLINLRTRRTIKIRSNQKTYLWFVGLTDEKLFFVTDKDAPLDRVVSMDITSLTGRRLSSFQAKLKDEIPERKEFLKRAFVWSDFIVCIYETKDGDRVERYRDGAQLESIKFPIGESVSDLYFGDFPHVRILTEGYTHPCTSYDLNFKTGNCKMEEREHHDFDVDQFVTEKLFARSRDGSKVPFYVRYKKGLKLNGNNPTILTGYGGFNRHLTPFFNYYDLLWNAAGGIVVDTVLRGDCGLGTQWRRQGTRENKQNTFDDFLAVAQTLIRKKYTRPERLGIIGGSNGGLLMGAALTQRPDLFGAVIINAGMLDMLRFHTWGTEKHYAAEYCSATNKNHFKILRAYSPLHNIKNHSYPPTLISTGSHDDRVNPAHSYKFAATLRRAQTGASPVLMSVEMNVGHGFVRSSMRDFDRMAFFGFHLGLLPNALYK